MSTYTGTSIVDYLGSIGQASDFNSRAKLAAAKGIVNYTGTADQNTQLLNALRSSTPTPAPTGGTSIPFNPAPTGGTSVFNQSPSTQTQTTTPQTAYQPKTVDASGSISSLRSQIQAGQIDPTAAYDQLSKNLKLQYSDDGQGNFYKAESQQAYQNALASSKTALFSNLGTIKTTDGQLGNVDSNGNVIRTTTKVISNTTSASGGASTNNTSAVYGGGSIVDYLTSVGQPNDYNSRAALAAKFGIQGYSGTAAQNIQLLTLMRSANATGTSAGVGADSPTSAPVTADSFGSIVSGDPFLSDLLKDPATKAMYDSLPDNLKGVFLQTASSLGKAVASGKVVNPDIQITPAQNQQFLDQATTELDPYYKEQLDAIKSDLQTSTDRLMEDYNKGVSRSTDTFKQTLDDQSQNEADSGTAFSSGRVDRQNRTVNLQQNALDDALTGATRSAQDNAVAYERNAGSNAVRSLNIPSLSIYSASTSGITPTGGTRSLYAPLGNVALGVIPGNEKVAIANRRSELESAYRTGRNLDLNSLS